MNVRKLCFSVCVLGQTAFSQAAQGLVPPTAETLWPQWQARIAVQATSLSPLNSTSSLFDASGSSGSSALQGGALLGDYYFKLPGLGSTGGLRSGFRASGGLMSGPLGSPPLFSTSAGARLDLTVNRGSVPLVGNDTPGTVPYLGLGYSGSPWSGGLSITADVGLVAEHAGAMGRAVFGNQGFDGAVRELRLSPVLQLGVRYSF